VCASNREREGGGNREIERERERERKREKERERERLSSSSQTWVSGNKAHPEHLHTPSRCAGPACTHAHACRLSRPTSPTGTTGPTLLTLLARRGTGVRHFENQVK